MDFSSFVTSLLTSFVIFLVLLMLFVWLSRKAGNTVIYYPNRLLKGMEPWDGSSGGTRNPFSWIREAISSTEEDVINMSGVDTAVYFVFLGTVLGIFVLSGLILLPLLLPLAATDDNLKAGSGSISNGSFSDLDKISMGNIKEKSSRLWGFLIAVYWVSFVTYYFLWKAYNHVATLRATALMSTKAKPEQFAVLVRDIPDPASGQSRKDQVDSYFKCAFPDSFYRSMIVTDNKEVNKIYEELEGYKKKLAHAEAVYALSKKAGKSESVRPTMKTGFLGLVGKKVDTIDYLNEKISETLPKLESEQKTTLKDKQQGAALVFFNDRVAATCAGQTIQSLMVDTWTVMEAPESRQVIWPNLSIRFFERQLRKYVIYVFVAAIIFFYMIPIAFISAFTTLENLKKYLPFTKSIVNIAAVRTILEAYLPQIALIVFLALLPGLLHFLSKQEGIPSEGHIERATSGKYFYFTVLNVFLGVTIGGSLFQSAKEIQKKPDTIATKLASSLPGSAGFFLTFVALKFFVGYGLELTRLVPLIIFHLKKKYMCKTEDEVKAAWAPGDLGYTKRVASDMLVVTIVLCYSVIAPLILPFGALYFAFGWLVLRNQALKVYVPSYETYGRMWPHLHKRVLASLLLYQVTMLGYFGLKKFYYVAFLVVPPVISLIFWFICSKKFYAAFAKTPLEVAGNELKEVPNMEEVFRSFIPPSLCAQKADDELFEDALSETSRAGSIA